MALEPGSDETAEAVEDSSPSPSQTEQLTPLRTKLAQQALVQQQRLFAQRQENSSFGVQPHASESPSAVVLTTEETPGNLSSRRGRAERSLLRQGSLAESSDRSHGLSARVFYRREEPVQAHVEAQYGSEIEESEEEGYCENSDYIEGEASEFPYPVTRGVHQAAEHLDLEACSEEEEDSGEAYVACLHEDDLKIANPVHLESSDLTTQRTRGPEEGECLQSRKKAIDESTPQRAYYEGKLPINENQGLESSRSCKAAPTAPFSSAFSTVANRQPTLPGCKTPLEQHGGHPSPMHACISQTAECTNKKRPATKAKSK